MRRILILGGGTGGTLVANRLRRAIAPHDAMITVVDQDDRHLYGCKASCDLFGLAQVISSTG
jgi:sulfide:quinone oxidoreductase